MNEMLAMPRALSEQTVELRIGIILTRKEVSFSAIPPRKGSNDAPSHIVGRDKIFATGRTKHDTTAIPHQDDTSRTRSGIPCTNHESGTDRHNFNLIPKMLQPLQRLELAPRIGRFGKRSGHGPRLIARLSFGTISENIRTGDIDNSFHTTLESEFNQSLRRRHIHLFVRIIRTRLPCFGSAMDPLVAPMHRPT